MTRYIILVLTQFILSFLILREKMLANSLISSRIIGGELANPGEFNWAAGIYTSTASGTYFCTGTILNAQWIITAAQCVDGGVLFTLVLGSTKLQGDPNSVRVSTESYVLHPDYNPDTLENNIGLIQLRLPLTFTDYLNRIWYPFDPLSTDEVVTATGWGQISDSSSQLSNDLYSVKLAVLSNNECKIYYGNQISDNMICAIGNLNEGACIGDTGGPLVREIRLNVWSITAVASFISSAGCESGHPSGYTNIWNYRIWMTNVTGA